MRFPDKLTVVARDRETGAPVENVAVVLELFAVRKNNYNVLLITDQKGQAEFTREECEFSIKQSQGMFIMDYHSRLEECRPLIEVRLHPPEYVEGMIRQYREAPDFWGSALRDPQRLFAALRTVKNAEYEQA